MKDAVFELAILGSGSSGNSALITTENCRILVDIGFSAKQVCHRLAALSVAPETLDAILLTHEHSDHIAGLEVFTRKFKVPIYCNRLTAEALKGQGIGTDAKLVRERIREVHTLVIETNHDERKLQDDPKRPWSVKQRILSRHGHLSNRAAATLVAEIAGDHLERVILGHLSRDCNTQDLALAEMDRLGLSGLELFCAQQQEVSPRFCIKRRPPEPTVPNDLPKIAEQIDPIAYHHANHYHTQDTLDLQWDSL